MTTEEQRRAFADYMDNTAAATNPQNQQRQQQQQLGLAAGLQNPYAGLHGLHGLQGLQMPYASQPHPTFNPVSTPPIPPACFTYPVDFSKISAVVPSRSSNNVQYSQVLPAVSMPPPATSTALASNQQLSQPGPSMPPPPRLPGYVELPRNYQAQQQPTQDYNVGWQYSNPTRPPPPLLLNPASPTTIVQAGPPGPITESTNVHVRDQYHYRYQGVWPPPDVVSYPSAPRSPPPDPNLHVLLCHVCSSCGSVRSTGYHRHHPVIPSQPAVMSVCRRCKKKSRKDKEKREEKSDACCKYPGRSIRIQIDGSEPRGRRREREEVVYVARRHSSPSHRRTIVRSRSRANVGLRVRPQQSPARVLRRTRTEIRSSSSTSPQPEVRFQRHRSDEVYYIPEEYLAHHSGYRFQNLSSSPPPARTSLARVECERESYERRQPEYRRRSLSPPHISREEHRSDDARSRLAQHPAAFRTIVPNHQSYLRESERGVSTGRATRPFSPRGILKDPAMGYQTWRRRQMETSHDSMLPEVGHARVQFAAERTKQSNGHISGSTSGKRSRYAEGQPLSADDFDFYHRHAPRGYIEELSPSPSPSRKLERLRIRTSSSSPPGPLTSPPRGHDEEIRVRNISPDSPGHYEEVRVRRRSTPSPSRTRASWSRERSPIRPSYSGYRVFPEPRRIERVRYLSPQPNPKHEDWDDVTESGSEMPEEIVQVRKYREIDENGESSTIVEERRTRLLAPGAPASVVPKVRRGLPLTSPAISRGYQSARDL